MGKESFEARVQSNIAERRRAEESIRSADAEERQRKLHKQVEEQQKQQRERAEAQRGLQLADVFNEEEVETCRDFLGYMAKNSYPGTTKLYVPPAQRWRRNFFGFMVEQPSSFTVEGYPLQMYTGAVRQPISDVAYLCEDERVRFADSASFGITSLKNIPSAGREKTPVVGFHLAVQTGTEKREVSEAFWHGAYYVDQPVYRYDFHAADLDTYLTRLAVLVQV
jgi:hypothetical protein